MIAAIGVGVSTAGCGRADGAAADDTSQRPTVLVVRHATVLDTRTAQTLADRAIVMRGERIVQVVPDSALDSLRGARELDARGRLVIPGLIDVHHHSSYVFPIPSRPVAVRSRTS